MVICAVSLTACILFHGPCMTSVRCNGALRALQPLEPPSPAFCSWCWSAGLAAEAPKEEQAMATAFGTCQTARQPAPPTPSPRLPFGVMRSVRSVCCTRSTARTY